MKSPFSNIKNKILMLKLQEIVLQELNFDEYYKNGLNIAKIIPILDEEIGSISSDYFSEKMFHKETLVEYSNGFYIFDSCDYKIPNTPEHQKLLEKHNLI